MDEHGRRSGVRTRELATAAVFSALIAVAWSAIGYIVKPPIIAIPFAVSLLMAASMRFTRYQWLLGVISLLLVLILMGLALPGPLFLPVYGVVFWALRRARLAGVLSAGAISGALHLLYGTLLAPIIFSVAPAKLLLKWSMTVIGHYVLAALVLSAALIAVEAAAGAWAGFVAAGRVEGARRGS